MRSPTVDFIKQGWAIYSIDYRPAERISIEPIETDDTIEAIKTVRQLPFIDPARLGLMGGSHGANVGSKVISRVDISGAILCATAAMDLIEVKKAVAGGEQVVPILLKLIGDMEKQYRRKRRRDREGPGEIQLSHGDDRRAGTSAVRC